MRAPGGWWWLAAPFVLSGCIVAPCPKDKQCDVPVPSTPLGGAGGGGPDGSMSMSMGGANAGPSGVWVNATGNLAGLESECGTLSDLAAKPDEDMLLAGIAKRGVWGSMDGGGSFTLLGQGAGSDPVTNRATSFVFDPENPKRFWESGIYNGFGVYETTDDGVTLRSVGPVSHTDLVSIDFTDPERKVMLAGGHEQSKVLNRSTDGGKSWQPVGASLPDDTNCTTPLVIDGETHLVGCGGFGGGPSGIFRTENGGKDWARVSEGGGAGRPLRASDGSIYWETPFGAGLVRSTDQGVTWTKVAGAGVLFSVPIELPDGRIAALGESRVIASSDHGATWMPVSSPLPYSDALGVVYSQARKAFYIWRSACGVGGVGVVDVPDDAIERYDIDQG